MYTLANFLIVIFCRIDFFIILEILDTLDILDIFRDSLGNIFVLERNFEGRKKNT